MSVTTELIAAQKSLDDIWKYIGADALIYQYLDDLKGLFEGLPTCMAYLDSKHPTEGALDALHTIEQERLKAGEL